MGKIVAVLGTTNNKEKFANRAIKLLIDKGHTVEAVNPSTKRLKDYTVIDH